MPLYRALTVNGACRAGSCSGRVREWVASGCEGLGHHTAVHCAPAWLQTWEFHCATAFQWLQQHWAMGIFQLQPIYMRYLVAAHGCDEKVWDIVRITKMQRRHRVSRYCWENGADRLAQWGVATNLRFVRNAVFVSAVKQRILGVLVFRISIITFHLYH